MISGCRNVNIYRGFDRIWSCGSTVYSIQLVNKRETYIVWIHVEYVPRSTVHFIQFGYSFNFCYLAPHSGVIMRVPCGYYTAVIFLFMGRTNSFIHSFVSVLSNMNNFVGLEKHPVACRLDAFLITEYMNGEILFIISVPCASPQMLPSSFFLVPTRHSNMRTVRIYWKVSVCVFLYIYWA